MYPARLTLPSTRGFRRGIPLLAQRSLERALSWLQENPALYLARVRLAIALGEVGAEIAPEQIQREGFRSTEGGDAVAALWALLTLRSAWPKRDWSALEERFLERFSERSGLELPSLPEVPRGGGSSVNLRPQKEKAPLPSLNEWSSYQEALRVLDVGLSPQTGHPSTNELPLIGFLPYGELAALLPHIRLSRRSTGDCIVEEGELGGGIFYLLEGRAEVFRRGSRGADTLHLTDLTPGALIGEMSLFTEAPRIATVSCKEPCWVIELPESAFSMLTPHLPILTRLLSGLIGQRMLTNLRKSSSLLRSLGEPQRRALLNTLEVRPVKAGEELIQAGVEGPGLFLIMDGLIQVNLPGEGNPSWLREGELFGEISLLRSAPATASCTSLRRGLLLFLSRERFSELIEVHPELREALERGLQERILSRSYTLA